MKYKLFEEYTYDTHPGFYETEEEIHEWLKRYDITKYEIHSDMSVDVLKGNVNVPKQSLAFIPVKFNKVQGYFYCQINNLDNLIGAPKEEAGGLYCWNNSLRTLKGAPKKVNGTFDCSDNHLITLQYLPQEVKKVNCRRNLKLISLGHKSKIKEEFQYDEPQGSLDERWRRYLNHLEGDLSDDKEEQLNSLQWLYDVDEDFRELVVKYAAYNDIDLPGVNMDIAKDASKHKDSGLF